ncbi:LytR/AlgR family response regulator transcription factor [Oxalobacteraceae bacterium A2-2]
MTAAASPALRVLVVDDEEPGRINLRYALARHAGWSIAGECASAAAARELLQTHPADLVLLDIQMPRESGMDLARSLCLLERPPLIIFVTAYNSYAVQAFEVHALDYLLKPVDDERLAQALERARAMLAQRRLAGFVEAQRAYLAAQDDPQPQPPYWQQLSVRSVGRIECVRLDEVLWLEAEGNYVRLHLARRQVLYRMPLSRLEQHLDPARFVRVHRRAIVAAGQGACLSVTGDGSYRLALRCGATVDVSERHAGAVRARLGDA